MNDECPFEISNLVNMLKNWKLGNFSTEDWSTCPQKWVPVIPSVSEKNIPTCINSNTKNCLNPLCTIENAKLIADEKIKENMLLLFLKHKVKTLANI